MDLHTELRELQSSQRNIKDGYRLFYDGSIKTATVTDNLETGWYVLARPVPGASIAFRSYFPGTPHGLFLKVEDMREAISIRDKMIETVVESRVQKRFEMGLETKQQTEPGKIPASF